MRVYKVICTQLKEPPEPGDIFPLLRDLPDSPREEREPDDEFVFQAVTASLTQYGGL